MFKTFRILIDRQKKCYCSLSFFVLHMHKKLFVLTVHEVGSIYVRQGFDINMERNLPCCFHISTIVEGITKSE